MQIYTRYRSIILNFAFRFLNFSFRHVTLSAELSLCIIQTHTLKFMYSSKRSQPLHYLGASGHLNIWSAFSSGEEHLTTAGQEVALRAGLNVLAKREISALVGNRIPVVVPIV
jgi:hypothetical protein